MRLIQVVIFFALLGVIVFLFQEQFLALVFWIVNLIGQQFPILKPGIDFIVEHTLGVDYIGVFLVMFFGRNAFVPIPLEPYLLIAYVKTGNFIAVWLISSIAIALAASCTYLLGYVVGKRFVEFVFKEKVEKSKWFEKYTGVFAFAVAILPFPEILSVIFGVHRSSFKQFFLGTLFGTMVKFALILLLYNYFEAQVYTFFSPYLETLPFLKAFFIK
jgi:membrane protein YqaA with SNARE-associated domain